MTESTYRVLKRKGRISLIRTSHPKMGIAYSVKIGTLRLWSGEELGLAEEEFERATSQPIE
jgi:hypothetical protein